MSSGASLKWSLPPFVTVSGAQNMAEALARTLIQVLQKSNPSFKCKKGESDDVESKLLSLTKKKSIVRA